MPFTDEQLKHIFTYHAPSALQQKQYQELRDAALTFAQVIVSVTQPSADQTTAIRKLRECVMTANASIALDGKF